MPNLTYIDRYIADGHKEIIRMENLIDTHLISNPEKTHIYRAMFDDFFIQHEAELKESIQLAHVPYGLYYKPKWMSLQIYGTTELWLALLRANNMKSISDFHWPIINVYSPGRLKQLISIFFKREGKE